MSNTGITLTEVRTEAMDAIKMLKNGTMDVKVAKEIRGFLDTVVDTAKTQVDFLNALPDNVKGEMSGTEVKAIAGTLRDRDAELDESLAVIEQKGSETYSLSGK